MKNIFKIGLISRFVMLFLFMLGLNTVVATPALAGGDSYEIDFFCNDGNLAAMLFLEEGFDCSEITVPTTCDGKTVLSWKDTGHSGGTNILSQDVCDYARYILADDTFIALWPETYQTPTFTVEYCMPFSHTQADFDRCVLNGDCDVCDPITIDETKCPSRSSSFNYQPSSDIEQYYVPALDTKVGAGDIDECELLYAIAESGNSDHRLIESDWSDYSTGESVPTGYKRVKFYTSSNSYITERDYYMGEYTGTLPTASELGLSAVSGKDFIGWTLKGDANCNIDFGVIDTSGVVIEPLSACSSTVFTATAAYADKVKIQFYANGGTGSAPTYTCNMKSCILPQNTYTKTGYKFTKWLVEDGAINFGSNELFNAGTNIVSEFKSDQSNVGITLTPQWEATCNAITIRGSTRGGSGTYTIYKKTGSSTVYTNSSCTTSTTTVPSELLSSVTKTNAMFAGTTNDCIKAEETAQDQVKLSFNTASSCNVTGGTTWDARFYCKSYWRGDGKNLTGACKASGVNFVYFTDSTQSTAVSSQHCEYGAGCSAQNINDLYDGVKVGYSAGAYLYDCLSGSWAADNLCDGNNNNPNSGQISEETSLANYVKEYIDNYMSTNYTADTIYGDTVLNIALYPYWVAVTNNLHFYESASASSYTNVSCPYGEDASKCMPAGLTKAGHTLVGFCRGKNDSCSNVIGLTGTDLSTLASGSTTIDLTAIWQVNVYPVKLDVTTNAPNGRASVVQPSVVYEKYNIGWYTDENATTPFTQLTKLPKASNYVFSGFYYNATGTSNPFIDYTGKLTETSATVFNAAGTPQLQTVYARYSACTCTKGSNVSACTVASVNDSNQCVYNVTCNSGYTNASNVGQAGKANNTMTCGTAATYTITFDANGGSGGQSGTKSATYATALPSISTTKPTKTGYTFTGWYDGTTATAKQYYNADGAAVVAAYDVAKDLTLYAHWTANVYKISLYKNDGTITLVQSVDVTYGGQIPASVSVPTRTGYSFNGYYTSTSGGTRYYDKTGARVYEQKWVTAGNVSIHAQWTPIEYTCAASYYLPAGATSCVLCKDGHYCVGGTYQFNETSDQGIGECPTGTYTVAGSNVRFECTPCAKGKINSSSTDTGCEACPNTNNGVASWEQTHWNATDGVTGLCTITGCSTGYTFSGTGANTKCTPNTYTVTLNSNGGSGGTASVTATFDTAMPSATMPTRANYTFAGYYDTSATSGGNKYYNANGTSAKTWDKTSATTLYARWTPNVYKITLDSFPTGGKHTFLQTTDANPTEFYIQYGVGFCSDSACKTKITKITTLPTALGLAFTGYYTTSAGTGTALISSDGVINTSAKNATTGGTWYGGWSTATAVCAAGKYLPKGSNTCASCLAGYYCEGGTYAYNSTTNQGLTGVCASGYSTGGATASTCSACSTGYAATGTAATNHDAADDCKPITYYINYSCGDGTGIAPAQVTAKYDTTYTAAANTCTKTGYSFTGWKCSGSTACDFAVGDNIKNLTSTSSAAVTLTAQWKANTYRVCFNANGGSGTPSCISATYDAALSDVNLDNVKRTGFTFKGIYDTVDESGKKYYNTNGSSAVETWDKAGDTTLYAVWTANQINCNATYYLPANSITCTKCEAGYYCPDAGTYTYNATTAQGRKQCSQYNQYSTEGRQYCLTCPDGGQIHDVNSNGLQDAASECYKEVDYVAAHGIGKQTCYYSATDSEYNLNCYDKSITACATGYELENSTDLDCKLITYNVVYYDGSTKLTNFNSSAYQYSIEAPITTLPTPQKEGYQFVGWYTNSNLTGIPVTQITSSNTGNKTLYAKYVSLAKVTLYLDAGPCTAPENKSITIYENQLDELYTILTSDKNLPNCDNIGGTYHGFYYIDMGENDDPCMINSDGACNGLVVDGDTLSAYVTYDPIICAAGTYLRAGWISSCTECPAGSYCGGSGENGFWWDKNKDQGIEKCPTNYTSYAGKAADKTDCYAVLEPGKYVKNAGDTTFTTCPVGSFCPGTDIINYGEAGGAKKCWSGNYCPETGMAEQTPCPAGYYCPDSGMTQPTVCSGSTYTETTGKSSCDACPSGYSIADSATNSTDHDKKSDCKITCAPGYYLEPNANSCSKVGYNYYSAGGTVGYGYNIIKSECPNGGLTSTETANSSASCYVVNECDLANGTGTQSCSYTSGGYTNCGDCSLTTCDNGFIKDASGECVARPITIKYLCDGENVSATKTCYVTDSECRLDYDGCTKTGHTLEDWLIETTEQDIVDAYIHGDLITHGFIAGLYDDFWEYGNQTITVTPNRWNANKITVKYQVDGKIVKTVECAYGSACNVATDIATPTQVGGIFAGWTDENEAYAPGDALNLPESGEYLLRADFSPIKYSISYDKNGGAGDQIVNTNDCSYNTGCTLTTSIYTKDGKAFLGWSTDPNATTAEYKSGASVMNLTATDGDIVTLYAVWKTNVITIKYLCDGSTVAKTQKCDQNSTECMLDPNACDKEGYDYVNYDFVAVDSGITSIFNKDEDLVNNGFINELNSGFDDFWNNGAIIELRPDYNQIYTVPLQFNPACIQLTGQMPTDMSCTNLSCELPDANIACTGYKTWNKVWLLNNAITFNDSPYNVGTNIKDVVQEYHEELQNAPVVVLPDWQPVEYTIRYDENKPTGVVETVSGTVESTAHVYNRKKNIPTDTYSLHGYTQNGWNTTADGSGQSYSSGDEVMNLTTENGDTVTLYAQWTEDCYKVNVCYSDGEYTEKCESLYQRSTDANVLYNDSQCRDGYDVPMDVYAGSLPNSTPIGFLDRDTSQQCVGDLNTEFAVTGNCVVAADGSSTWVVNYQCDDGYTGAGEIVSTNSACTQSVFNINVSYSCGGNGTEPSTMICSSSDASCELAQSGCKKDGFVLTGWNIADKTYSVGDDVRSLATMENNGRTYTAAPQYTQSKFVVTTTDGTDEFSFSLSAAGTYYIDWGDSTQVVTLDAPVSSSAMHTVSHTYKTAGKYKIQFAGQATKYYPDGQWGMNTSAISFANNTNVAEIDGSLGAIFATLTSGEQTQPRFKETFKGNTSLNGSIPETLLDGIHGQPSRRMFQDMFRGCTNLGGSIPSNMFANLSGTPTDYLFSGTFADCKNLSGQIPAFDTFTGTLTAEQNTKAFGATFWNAGVGADENGTPLFLPDNLFDGLNPSGFVAKQMELIFTGTKFATECPNNMYKVTATENPFVADWADKAMCNACPLDSLRTASSVAGENNGAISCFVTCPENITITNGTTSVVKSVLNYTGTSYPSCTYNAQCDTGYDVQNNATSNPTCGANTYTVTYQTDTQTVVDVVYGQQFEFNQTVPEKVGYTKLGWLDNNGKLYAINETITYNVAYNISVVPQYTANKYVATYDCDNASENITEEITYDADYTLKTNACTKQGYAFVGWTVDGNLVANSFKWTYPSDTVFIAKWNPLTYDVTYDCGEGTGAAPSSTNVAYDRDFTTAANTCTNVGYNFVGWKVSDTDNSFGADETFSWKYLENKTFVAQWNAQKITCQSGQYLDKTNCLSCDAGYKCPAEPITYTYDGTIQGRVACSGATEYQNQPGQTMCKIVDDGYYKTSDTTQVQCGNNYYCKNSVRTQCADGGITDTATASVATQCYKTGVACTTVGGFGTNTCNYNLTTKDYTDCAQCIVDGCDDGYYLDKGTCVICPVGSYCANSVRTSCPINYTTKQTGAVTDVECFTTCSDKEVVYGTAFADNSEVFWPAACTHTYGISVTGNACKIVDNVCVETACNYNYEMINGKCELCVRDNALSFKQGAGNCIVETCLYGYYPFGQSCVGDTRECSVAGAVYAEQKWNPKTNSFGPCEIKECSEGTHIEANACVPDVQSCELEHGTGEKIYNNQLNKWGDCIATSCMPGYTNDPKLTNETWKQCGQCNNRFGASGEPVVSGYISECEIATCMYQGEKYILENNECRLICDERNDETGSRYWNGSKCVHNCNPGFLAW